LRKLRYFAVRALPLLVLSVVPGLQAIAIAAWFAFECWVSAHEYLDHPLANSGYSFAEQREILAASRPLVLGFGLGVMSLTLCPIINFLAMPAAVAGATELCHNRSLSGPVRVV
jgi:CysZ protein